jgi:hypothetical protein
LKLFTFVLLGAFLIFPCFTHAQDALSSEDAFRKYKELRQIIKSKNLKWTDETYWAYYFEIDDLLKYITNQYAFILEHYYKNAYNFRYLDLPKESIKLYKQFFKYYDTNEAFLTSKEKVYFFHYRSAAYGYLADVYAKASYLDSASLIHKKNVKLTQQNSDVDYASALNNYGLFYYWTKKELDSALIYFKKSYELTESAFPENHLLGSIRDNIADIYTEQGKIAQSNALYKANFEFYKTLETQQYKGIDSKRLVAAGVQLINTSIQLGALDHVENILSQIHNVLNDTTSKIALYPISKLQYLQAKERVLIAQNKAQEAYQLSKAVKHLSDSLTQIDNTNKNLVENAISELTFERLKTKHIIEKQQKESQIKNQRLKLWIISILSISILGFLASLYWRRRQHIVIARNKQQITQLKNEQLNSEIESKQRDLSDFAINLTQSQEWAKELASKLDQLKTTKGRERKKLFDAFEQDVQNKITFDVDTKAFYQRLDKLNDAFYSELHAVFPDLSKTDKRLCSLIRLKIDSHEIATLQNITLSSLNTSRYRLRKKLNLSKDDDLDDFIQSL